MSASGSNITLTLHKGPQLALKVPFSISRLVVDPEMKLKWQSLLKTDVENRFVNQKRSSIQINQKIFDVTPENGLLM